MKRKLIRNEEEKEPFCCNQATVVHKPRLLSDNGSSNIAAALANDLEDKGMDHETHGKFERWHQTMKNRVLLENDFSRRPGKADQGIRRSL